MKKILTLSFLLFGLFIFGQTNEKSKHYLGGHAGSISGLGFSYRYWPNKIGFQVTGVPIFQEGGEYFHSVGASLLYLLKDHKNADLYAYTGFHLIARQYNYYDYSNGYEIITPQKVNRYTTGAGIGVKFDFLKVLDVSVQGGYGLYFGDNSNFNTSIAGGIGIYYHL
ncbi:MAG: hypothetical protein ACWA41_00305 [Putridiphycobacter sp.]